MFRVHANLHLRFLCFCALALVAALVAGCAPYRESALASDPGPTVYRLDTGDQVRLYVFDQETMSRNYAVDDRGNISIPLVGNIRARGRTSAELERAVSLQLARANIVSDAKVSVEVVGYRPFFIYGEVRGAGRYVYQPNMNVEMALATAGGVTERGNPQVVRLTRIVGGQRVEGNVGLDFPIQPGDTVFVYERWF